MWKEFATTLAAVVLGGGGLGYYFRDKWTHRLSKELEEFKVSLAADLFQKQWLHSEQSKVLLDLYPLLSNIDRECDRALVYASWAMQGHLPPDNAGLAFEQANDKLTELFVFLTKHEALLDRQLAAHLRVLARKYQEILGVAPVEGPPSESQSLSAIEQFKRMKNETAPRLKEIQDTIQKMLGVA